MEPEVVVERRGLTRAALTSVTFRVGEYWVVVSVRMRLESGMGRDFCVKNSLGSSTLMRGSSYTSKDSIIYLSFSVCFRCLANSSFNSDTFTRFDSFSIFSISICTFISQPLYN